MKQLYNNTEYPVRVSYSYAELREIFMEIYEMARQPASPYSADNAFHDWMKENYPNMELFFELD